MTDSISSAANDAIDQMFAALDGVLQKGAAYAKANDIEEEVLLNWRLAPDMFPLVRQIRIATELPARALSRLAGADLPVFSDDETTFAQCRDRIVKARAFIKGLSSDAIDADPDKTMSFPLGPDNSMEMKRLSYFRNFILPNLYFHVTAAYAILRQVGVDLGKRDFLAVPQE
jgi:hypothetical protein